MTKSKREFISAKLVAGLQRRHFLLWTVVPALLTVIYLVWNPFVRLSDSLLLIGMWTLTGGLGISVGYHRYFAHHAFDAHPLLQVAMGWGGSMAAQGSITYWVSLHRCHHQHSDESGDPHSPQPPTNPNSYLRRIRAFFHGHMGWVLHHDVPSPAFYSRDLSQSSIVRFFDRTYPIWPVVGVVLPGLIMFGMTGIPAEFLRGCIWGGLLRILIGNQIIWGVNSLGHTFGGHPFDTHDHSTNNLLLVIPAFGEGWHNNHHAFPWSAKFGLRWWQIDLGWTAIRIFSLCGLAKNLKFPSQAQLLGANRSP